MSEYAGTVTFRDSSVFPDMHHAYWNHDGAEGEAHVATMTEGVQINVEYSSFTHEAARAFAHDLPLILDELERRAGS